MAFSFPLSIAQFMDWLPISEISFNAPAQQQVSQTGGGEVISAKLGPQLWRGQFTLGRMTRDEARHPAVLLDLLADGGRTFLAYDTRHPAPQLDPTGSILGAATPTIYGLSGNSREMRLDGLPAAYKLKRGDYLAFDYGGRRALHRVAVATVTADAAGITPMFEVVPMIRPGALVGTGVTLVQAACRAKLVPGQIDHGRGKAFVHEGMSFQFIQSLQ